MKVFGRKLLLEINLQYEYFMRPNILESWKFNSKLEMIFLPLLGMLQI